MDIEETEQWRLIPDWPYEVSSLGRIRRTSGGHLTYTGRFLKPVPATKGYHCVTLAHEGRRLYQMVHILVCTIFHGPRPSHGHDAAHWNGNHQDNRAVNLRWATRRENILDKERHGRMARGMRIANCKLSDDDVREIRRNAKNGVIARLSAKRFGVHPGTIHAIVQRRWRSYVQDIK